MLGKFSKGAGGRGVCRATDNSLTILMALSVDDMKVILERAEGGGGSTVLETRSLRVSGIYTL